VFVQARLADAALAIDAAHESLRRDWRELVGFVEAGAAIPMAGAHPLPLRRDPGRRPRRARRRPAVEASGGRAIFLDNPIQRAFRDVHAMRAHAFNTPTRALACSAASSSRPIPR